MTDTKQFPATFYQLRGHGTQEDENDTAYHLMMGWQSDVTARWSDCEGKCQISLRRNMHGGFTIDVSESYVPQDCELPHKEIFATDWIECRPHKADDEEISGKLYDIENAHESMSRPFEHRLAGTRFEYLSARAAIEVLLYLKDEGVVFPEDILHELAVSIEEDKRYTPRASEWLESVKDSVSEKIGEYNVSDDMFWETNEAGTNMKQLLDRMDGRNVVAPRRR